MRTEGYKPLLAFYNQTHHSMTMAAGLHAIGDSFNVDEGLAKNMLVNVEKVLSSIAQISVADQDIIDAWREVEEWLRNVGRDTTGSDHSPMIYKASALTYLTWTKLCNSSAAKQCAEEYYTRVEHPDRHPGIRAIKAIWSSDANGEVKALPATLPNIAAVVARLETEPKTDPTDGKTSRGA